MYSVALSASARISDHTEKSANWRMNGTVPQPGTVHSGRPFGQRLMVLIAKASKIGIGSRLEQKDVDLMIRNAKVRLLFMLPSERRCLCAPQRVKIGQVIEP